MRIFPLMLLKGVKDTTVLDSEDWTLRPERWLEATANIAIEGVRYYDQLKAFIYRPASALWDADTLRTFGLVPLTDGHPDSDKIAGNLSENSKILGHIGDPWTTGGYSDEVGRLRARLLVTEDHAIEDIRSGKKKELSCGYDAEIEPQTGSWGGQEYSYVMTKMIGNHIALVPQGRWGPDCSIGGTPMADAVDEKVRLKVRDDTAPEAQVKWLQTEVERLRAIADQSSAEAKKSKEDLKKFMDELPQHVDRLAKEAVELRQKVADVAPALALDGLSPREMKIAACVQMGHTKDRFEKATDAYVDAFFDAIHASAKAASSAPTASAQVVDSRPTATLGDRKEDAQTVFMESITNIFANRK